MYLDAATQLQQQKKQVNRWKKHKLDKDDVIFTKIASISLSETRVRLGWSEALPPTPKELGDAGTSDFDVVSLRLFVVIVEVWDWVPMPEIR